MASAFGEVGLGRGVDADWRVSQYSIGISSRGAGLAYRRDRYETGGGVGTWTVGGSASLGRFAAGSALTFHSSKRAWDFGLAWAPGRQIGLAAVLRNVGRPVVRDSTLRLTLVGGLTGQLGNALLLSAETMAVERRPASGYDLTHRAGLRLNIAAQRPVALLVRVDLDPDMRLVRWNGGLSVGSLSQLIGVLTGPLNTAGANRFETLSVAGLVRTPLR
jgi:hypothetical protein